MGGIQGLPNAEQRGHAAQLRQMDDNRGRTMLNAGERNLVNSIIHGSDENHSPRADGRLEDLTQIYSPNDPYRRPGGL